MKIPSKFLEYIYSDSYFTYSYYNWKYFGDEINLQWAPDHRQTCLSTTYIHTINSKLDVDMIITDDNNILITSINLKKEVSS